MSETNHNPDCPCTSTACPRHGDCDACKANHHGTGGKTACEKLKAKWIVKVDRLTGDDQGR